MVTARVASEGRATADAERRVIGTFGATALGVGYLAYFFDVLEDNRVAAAIVGLGVLWLLTGVNVAGVKQGSIVQNVTTVVKLIPLVGIAVAGPFFLDGDHFSPFNQSDDGTFDAITATATLTLWAFIGLESATVPAGDVREPSRTIPRSTLMGTLIAAAVYIAGTIAVLGVIAPDELASSTSPFADTARDMFGDWAGGTVAIGAIVSAFGALNGWILLQGQVPMAAANDDLFPRAFARRGPGGAPVVGLVVSSVLITLLMLANYNSSLVDQFTFVILLATLTTLVPYAYSAAAEMFLVAAGKTPFDAKRAVRVVVIAALGFLYALWAIAGAGYQVVFRGFLLLLAGIPVYVWLVWRRTREQASQEGAT